MMRFFRSIRILSFNSSSSKLFFKFSPRDLIKFVFLASTCRLMLLSAIAFAKTLINSNDNSLKSDEFSRLETKYVPHSTNLNKFNFINSSSLVSGFLNNTASWSNNLM
ncbi:hypothetical protein WICMUC_000035 [Wickerhamomyces mucosus]|uniref:Uncharacterized protein n=1 Tax=Wickerhamomyces mucosus TaxID=1378264 RepID=A0A9P8Q0D0_9ASCO|nr:hypothetical protein WICMUC_000035 [Wickerhamomyces mucosus]